MSLPKCYEPIKENVLALVKNAHESSDRDFKGVYLHDIIKVFKPFGIANHAVKLCLNKLVERGILTTREEYYNLK